MTINPDLQAKIDGMQSRVIPRDVVLKHVNRERVKELSAKMNCNARAAQKPLPGAAAQAFTSGPIEAGGRIVKRITPAHWAVLQGVSSPLVAMSESIVSAEADASGTKKVEKDWTPKDQWAACYIFTGDIEAIYNQLENEGSSSVLASAVKDFGLNEEMGASINFIMAAILEQTHRHLKTKVQYAAELEGGKEISFFQEAHPGN